MISKHDALAIHFATGVAAHGERLASGFMAGLRDARLLTGRDCETGKKFRGAEHGSWLGAIGYLVLLEQIGKCFMPTGGTRNNGGNGIADALRCFTSISLDNSNALCALRTSFACDYSLINTPRKVSHKPKYTHAFRVCGGSTAPIVTLPKKKWDGDRRSISVDTQTVVNLEALGDLVEDIVSQVLAMADGQRLTIILKGGTEALLWRYSL